MARLLHEARSGPVELTLIKIQASTKSEFAVQDLVSKYGCIVFSFGSLIAANVSLGHSLTAILQLPLRASPSLPSCLADTKQNRTYNRVGCFLFREEIVPEINQR